MSRVYEALKKAEGDRAAEQARKNGGAAPAEPLRRVAVERPAIQADTPPIQIEHAPNHADHSSNGADHSSKGFDLPPLHVDRSPHEITLPAARAEPLPLAKRNGQGPLLVMNQSRFAKAAEQFHLFAAGMQRWAVEEQKRVFMITSSVSGEGKSFFALNLAASLAQIGERVILVDADLRASTLHYAFDLAPLHGLIDYLKGEVDLPQCLQATSIPGLVLVAAGGMSYTPAETLAGPRMREFLRDARALVPSHYVIVDAPAASAVPEPEILSGLMDALVVVVAANRTPRELVHQTIEKVKGTPIFSLALNRFEAPRSAAVNYPAKYAMR